VTVTLHTSSRSLLAAPTKKASKRPKPMGEQIFSNFQHLLFPTDARREERGLGLTNKAFSKLDAFVSFVRMLARCKYFFSFKNKKSYISAERLFPISA